MTYIGNTSPSRFSSVPAVQRFSGNNSTTAFTLSTAIGSEQEILVSVDGVIQDTANYTVSGTTLTFSPAPSAGTNNIFVFTLSRAIASVTHPPTSALSATSGTFSGNVSVGGDLDVTGSLDMSDANLTNVGSISLDSISGDADANTNITFSGSDVITFTTGGSTAFTANANQSVTFNGNITAEGGDYLLRNSSGSSILSIISGTSGSSILKLGDTADFDIGQIEYNHGSNFLAIKTNDSERMRIDSSGRMGIGGSPTTYPLEVFGGNGDAIVFKESTNSVTNWFGALNSVATIGSLTNHPLALYSNGSERMRIMNNGNVIINGDSDDGAGSSADNLVIGNGDTHYGMTIYTGATHNGSIYFSDATSGNGQYDGYIEYNHNQRAFYAFAGVNMGYKLDGANRRISFHDGGSERMRIDSSGNLLVGKTTTAFGTAGVRILPTGNIYPVANGSVPLEINRLTSDGDIVKFYKDSSAVGSIGNAGARLFINSGTVGLNFAGDGSNQILPSNAGANRDAAIDLGTTNVRFKDLYLSGGVYLGGTGSANHLHDYEEGNFSPSLSATGSSFNYTTRISYYTKIGNRVAINVYIQLDGSQTLTNNTVTITGLPFTSRSSTSNVTASIAGVRYVDFDSGYSYLQARIGTNTTTISLLQNGDNQPGVNLRANQLSNVSGQIFINMTYNAN